MKKFPKEKAFLKKFPKKKTFLKNFLRKELFLQSINLLFPRYCPSCFKSHPTDGLCPSCWGKISFLSSSCCQGCATPFEYSIKDSFYCLSCLSNKPLADRQQAVFLYDDASKALVLSLKHQGKTEHLPLFGKWLYLKGSPFLKDIDIITNIPLHPRRLLKRGYNQSALLSKALWREHQKQAPSPACLFIPDLLQRVKHNPMQKHVSIEGRYQNLKGAFRISPTYNSLIQDQRILIVDDVMTTGATLEEAVKTLKKNGAGSLSTLVLGKRVLV